ncbi:50S ribosomal protein L15 [Candidatus Microgenomates bacterium]|nr:MAG: 50S ribosomal protein L15 [Candidatus Microgenomates bacterium]
MKLHKLTKIIKNKKRRLGQGLGSGRGKTSGRGTKGQKARGNVPIFFEGGALRLIKRLPFRRGKGRNRAFKKKPIVVNVGALNLLKKDSIVDLKALIENHIVDKSESKIYGVKILGEGELNIPLTVKLSVSKGALQKIEKAGGKVEEEITKKKE